MFKPIYFILACFSTYILPMNMEASQPEKIQTNTKHNKGSKYSTAPQYKLPPVKISADFPFKSSYANVKKSRIHYIEDGQGDPVIFIHGNPSSSYLWRNIIPYISKQQRAIAVDLIGMGKSDKPDIDYSFRDHYQYIEQFIEKLNLRHITFVVHDWGATIGFEYARRHPDNIKAIAFMEGVLPPAFPQASFEAMGKDMGNLFKILKDPIKGKQMVIDNNGFVEQLLPAFINRNLTESEMNAYRAPYLKKQYRKPTLAWPQQIPIGGLPPETTQTLQGIEQFMMQTDKPILLIYASPGAVLPPSAVPWYIETIKNLETAYVGQGLHFIQEDQPDAIGRALSDWLRRLQ